MGDNFPAILKIEGVECSIALDCEFVRKVTMERYLKDGGDSRFLWKLPIIEGDIIVEVGGYKGSFSEAIHKRYKPELFILEPIKDYFDLLKIKFLNINSIRVLNYGLGKSGVADFGISDAGTGLYSNSNCRESVVLKSLGEFITENELERIDLLAINIEGGEYELIPEILNSGFMQRVRRLLIQFHTTHADCVARRNHIRSQLERTHEESFCYPFVWECWVLK